MCAQHTYNIIIIIIIIIYHSKHHYYYFELFIMADNKQAEYMDKDLFVNGIPQAVFLKQFRREEDVNIERFDLRSIGNIFPGRMIFFNSLSEFYDSLEIKVCKTLSFSDSIVIRSNYRKLGNFFSEEVDVSTLTHTENIHIIISGRKGLQDEIIIGHLCCRFAVDNKFFVVVLMAIFESDTITRRNSFGSMLLVLAEEVKNMFANDSRLFVSFKSNVDNKQDIFIKFLKSLYFVEVEEPSIELQDYLKAPVTNHQNYYYSPRFPVILTTALFVWIIPQDNNNFPYFCKQVICYLFGNYKDSRNALNKKLLYTSSILRNRYPEWNNKINCSRSTIDAIEKLPDDGYKSDKILKLIINDMELVDLGFSKDPSSKNEVDVDDQNNQPKKLEFDENYESNLLAKYKNKEGHCLFFNAA
jgi:hypothetical protein